jgi:hypothetical protein
MNENTVTETQMKTLCKIGKGKECCSYLIYGQGGFVCAKGSPLEQSINARRQAKTMNAMGDNCSGAPDFIPTI